MKTSLHVEIRPIHRVAADLRDAILGYIKGHFYSDLPPERFFGDRSLLLRFVVLWPARWLAERGVNLPSDRYRSIMVGTGKPRGILVDASTLGQRPDNPVRYLATVVQSHWRIHGDEYYEEAKSHRPTLDNLVAALQTAGVKQPSHNAVELLSEAATLLGPGRRRRPASKPASQLDLL